jgi:hypothetical protein
MSEHVQRSFNVFFYAKFPKLIIEQYCNKIQISPDLLGIVASNVYYGFVIVSGKAYLMKMLIHDIFDVFLKLRGLIS